MNSPDIKTREQYIEICRKCGCTEGEIQELLDSREQWRQEFGSYLPWEMEPVPHLGVKERIYYLDDNGCWIDKEIGCYYEELGLTPPW